MCPLVKLLNINHKNKIKQQDDTECITLNTKYDPLYNYNNSKIGIYMLRCSMHMYITNHCSSINRPPDGKAANIKH